MLFRSVQWFAELGGFLVTFLIASVLLAKDYDGIMVTSVLGLFQSVNFTNVYAQEAGPADTHCNEYANVLHGSSTRINQALSQTNCGTYSAQSGQWEYYNFWVGEAEQDVGYRSQRSSQTRQPWQFRALPRIIYIILINSVLYFQIWHY